MISMHTVKLTTMLEAISACTSLAALESLLERACITWSVEGSSISKRIAKTMAAAPDLFMVKTLQRGGVPWMQVIGLTNAVSSEEELEAAKEAVTDVLVKTQKKRMDGLVTANYGFVPDEWPLSTYVSPSNTNKKKDRTLLGTSLSFSLERFPSSLAFKLS